MYKKITLKNGLRLILVPRKEIASVTVMFGVGTGSRDESEEVAGVSHIIEHMNFKGTKKRPSPIEVSEFIENIGGMSNAFTSKEMTGYYVKIASEHLEKAFDFIADNMQNSLNLKPEFEREKKVVIEDLKMHKDRPMEEVAELFEESFFTERSLARRIGGSPESVAKITLAEMVEFERKKYVAENCALCVVGNFGSLSEKDMIALTEKYFNLKSGEVQKHKKSGTADKVLLTTGKREIEQTSLIVGFAGPGLKDKDKYAARIMARILGGSMSSRMFTQIREKRGLAYAINTGCQSYTDTGTIYTQAGIAHDKIEEALKAILVEHKKIISAKVSENELSRAKEITRGGILISLEDSESVAESLLSAEIEQGELLTPEEIINKYLAVTIDDVQQAAKKYFDFKKMVVSVVGPKIDKEKIRNITSTDSFH